MIDIKDLSFEYFTRDEYNYLSEMITAINEINFTAEDGEFVVIAGRNGSGKSTFARILNRLLVPIDGQVSIYGLDALNPENIYEIRKKVSMIFQNPDSQIIGSIVEEDIAFGMENLGFSRRKMKENINKAIEAVGLSGKGQDILKRKVSELSGGEKQKLVIAGALAMEPKCLVLDESTSMLDPFSRKEIIDILIKQKTVTVILITHIMTELLYADTVYVFDKGKICLKGTPKKIFSDGKKLEQLGLELPQSVLLANRLYNEGIIKKKNLMTVDDIVNEMSTEYYYKTKENIAMPAIIKENIKIDPTKAILVNDISFSYGKKNVLQNIKLEINKGEFVGVIGETSAGKTTFIQSIAGLLKPQKGSVYVDGVEIYDKNTDQIEVNKKIGFLFQYPEQQLFAKNVYEDVLYGVKNLGLTKVEAEKRAYESIELVGLSQEVYDMSMNRLSGGQLRRVALAGVIAMKPEYLILDEPTAGLDPAGGEEMLNIISALREELNVTIIMVTHDIDSIVKYADRILLMENGRITQDGRPSTVLHNNYISTNNKENLPTIMRFMFELKNKGFDIPCNCVDEDECVKIIKERIGC
ncbi:MAG: energy-coupling factor transporter ATPase [Lachnospiraceae bacterium]|nr:energy-coupling factor transporter ATPase [Lachnospiraceae bacterium]